MEDVANYLAWRVSCLRAEHSSAESVAYGPLHAVSGPGARVVSNTPAARQQAGSSARPGSQCGGIVAGFEARSASRQSRNRLVHMRSRASIDSAYTSGISSTPPASGYKSVGTGRAELRIDIRSFLRPRQGDDPAGSTARPERTDLQRIRAGRRSAWHESEASGLSQAT